MTSENFKLQKAYGESQKFNELELQRLKSDLEQLLLEKEYIKDITSCHIKNINKLLGNIVIKNCSWVD